MSSNYNYYIEYLIYRKYNDAVIESYNGKIIGVNLISCRDEYSDKEDNEITAQEEIEANSYLLYLLERPEKEIYKLYYRYLNEDIKLEKLAMKQKDKKAFFNLPKAKANYKHWARFQYLTLEQITALFMGKDPRIVDWNTICEIKDSLFVQEYSGIKDILSQHSSNHKGEGIFLTAEIILLESLVGKKMPLSFKKAVSKFHAINELYTDLNKQQDETIKTSSENCKKKSGRPSYKNEILEEAKRRMKSKEARNNWEDECKFLRSWCNSNFGFPYEIESIKNIYTRRSFSLLRKNILDNIL